MWSRALTTEARTEIGIVPRTAALMIGSQTAPIMYPKTSVTFLRCSNRAEASRGRRKRRQPFARFYHGGARLRSPYNPDVSRSELDRTHWRATRAEIGSASCWERVCQYV